MARALVAAGSDSAGWFLDQGQIRRLREGGFYAGFSSSEDLQLGLIELEEARRMLKDKEIKEDVEDFYFLDEDSNLVSLFRLPLECCRTPLSQDIWLRGRADGGLCQVMKSVCAWNVQFCLGQPKLSVMTLQKTWIYLGKRTTKYEERFLSVFVLLSLLDFARKNVDASGAVIWDHLQSIYSYHENELPTEEELREHVHVLRRLVSRDEVLGSSDYVQSLLGKRKRMDDGEGSLKRQSCELEELEEPDEDVGDSVCAICDDGGDLLCCDGPCLRSFHGVKMEGLACKTLGLSNTEVKHTAKFFCKNCSLNQHQCFACGKLGSSLAGPSQEVFLCDVALCGKFYHLACVAKLLSDKTVRAGFTCPMHNCFKCGLRENEEVSLWLYQCRRCPRAWHRDCAGVSFVEGDDNRRGWTVGNARFLYCTKHVLDPELKTPKRDHLKFPTVRELPKECGQSLKAAEVPDQQKGSSSFRPPVFSQKDVEETVLKTVKSCKLSLEDVTSELTAPSTVRTTPNMNRLNRIESLLNAFRKATEYLKSGGSLDQAQLIFPPKDLKLLENSRDALRVYLSPMLYGMRYSSFGRHFTRTFKLEAIVDRLSWYVNAGDMVADLCCGSNEFSMLLSRKLDALNKACRYKNFDFIQPSDTFHFERRDYMSITQEELCDGDRLVMGLNPPFGTRAQLASKFVEHCTKFQPKIIVLIAPEETQRPDGRYVLTWEDKELLKGDAFYLPGSLDSQGRTIKQENNTPPVLYLWSRVDFAEAHRKIAAERGHLRRVAAAECAANLDVGEALQLSTTYEEATQHRTHCFDKNFEVCMDERQEKASREVEAEKAEVPSVESHVTSDESRETGELTPEDVSTSAVKTKANDRKAFGKRQDVQAEASTSSRPTRRVVEQRRRVRPDGILGQPHSSHSSIQPTQMDRAVEQRRRVRQEPDGFLGQHPHPYHQYSQQPRPEHRQVRNAYTWEEEEYDARISWGHDYRVNYPRQPEPLCPPERARQVFHVGEIYHRQRAPAIQEPACHRRVFYQPQQPPQSGFHHPHYYQSQQPGPFYQPPMQFPPPGYQDPATQFLPTPRHRHREVYEYH